MDIRHHQLERARLYEDIVRHDLVIPWDGAEGPDQLVLGAGPICALDAEGSASCWASDGSTEPVPTAAPPGQYRQLDLASGAYGDRLYCGVTVAGTATCWSPDLGSVDFGEGYSEVRVGDYFGLGLTTEGAVDRLIRDSPTVRLDDGPFSSLAVGMMAWCGLTDNGDATCFGAPTGEGGLMGDGPGVPLESIAMGPSGACGLHAGELVCWGFEVDQPTWSCNGDATPEFESVAIGREVACGTVADGTALCWNAMSGRRFDAPAVRLRDLDVAGRRACGVRTDGDIQCWSYANGVRWID